MLRILSVMMVSWVVLVAPPALANKPAQTLKTMLQQNTLPLSNGEVDVQLSQKPILTQFYQQRNYQPAWMTDARSEELVSQLLYAIDKSAEDGLDPSHKAYHKSLIQQLSYPVVTENKQAQIVRELLLSDAYITLGLHLHHGAAFKTEADTLHRTIKADRLNMPEILNTALQQFQIAASLSELAPKHQNYLNLKQTLRRYQEIANQGGWNTDPEAYLDPNKIKQRLLITGEFHDTSTNSITLDTANPGDETGWYIEDSNRLPHQNQILMESVKTFQKRQNLLVDGIVGKQTRIKLAESVHQVINRIRLNLERWRWFNPIPQDNYVMVNIPDFSMKYRHDGKNLSMHVVVGQKKRPTPMMQAKMSYLVLNPYWRIPKTILAEDILPKLRQDSGYLKDKQISLFSSADQAERHPLDAGSIDWNQVTEKSILQYIFRQEPGVKNPLGSVKFIFPNSENIYIHDTSARYLFKNKAFLVSSGCIRAEKPVEFAYQLLGRQQPEITYESTAQQIQSGERNVIHLKEKTPVFLTYQTAWSDDTGILYQRNDVYNHDANLMNFMKINLKMNLN